LIIREQHAAFAQCKFYQTGVSRPDLGYVMTNVFALETIFN